MNTATDNGLDIAANQFAQQFGLLACQLGAPAAARRACMRAAQQLIRAQARGDLCIWVEKLLGGEFTTLAGLRAALLESALVCDGRDDDAELRPLVLDADGRLYLARYYAFERRIAHGIAALARARRLTMISGGPGTGKTTAVMKMLAEALAHTPALRVALAAPTGKAAQRMLDALAAHAARLPAALAKRLPQQAFTLHRLLRAHAMLPYDWVIVDEASMLDSALAAQLLGALAPQSRLILLGDPNQLAAVNAGAVFAELAAPAACIEDLHPCITVLTRNYRFGSDSVIGQLAQAVCDGRARDALATLPYDTTAIRPGQTDGASLFWIDDIQNLSISALEYLAAGFEPYIAALADTVRGASSTPDPAPLFDALNRYRALAAVRFGPRGVDALNAMLAAHVRIHVHGSGMASDELWFAGRPVMIARNDYALGLFNGDTGIALPARDGMRVFFQTPDGGARAFSPMILPPHETAFALTVHKSQGTEFERIAFVLPAANAPEDLTARPLTRELVYTAITRARQSITILGAPDVFAQAIEARTMRMQGLAARLREIMDA
ncbi:Exodeoxyribonuclease V, alpha subunit [Candidatus Glomeribacter gigasporarum BEG34]|uniref:RecBCD enzyme subunit RecD n=1 Tax=Candidatus Glomeribacter gigasporarum BEG34 TaxID=1070319 RepID=G2J7X4_9BURK|nr:exodeoxyribonuclease V subunit alpha [Candidatus Glomeribacter gigasporarum]CCD28869.1 Exodeoxyribonuclease V, alpha subunit [Candidatus Glomeribacter gigasporarum BEG34]